MFSALPSYAELFEGYKLLIKELSLQTPISALISSQDPEAFLVLLNFLDKKEDIFNDYSKTHLVTQEFPVLITAILSILAAENATQTVEMFFLPDTVSAELLISV